VEIYPTKAATPGAYACAVESAGSVSLILQTIYLPLALARAAEATQRVETESAGNSGILVEAHGRAPLPAGPAGGESAVEISGGTHVPFSPPFEALASGFMTHLRHAGFPIEMSLARAGFYPAGGGRITARIGPANPGPLELVDRGRSLDRRIVVVSSNLPEHVASREIATLRSELGRDWDAEVRAHDAPTPGNAVILFERFERGLLVHSGVGARGRPAEVVARAASAAHLAARASAATVDVNTADQLILPLAFASGTSRYIAPRLSNHMRTQAWVLSLFLGDVVHFEERADGVEVRIDGRVPKSS
jgi:RNA 3'-terminal phosphate cyclase (ATP)